jgi:aminopeptidase N
MLALYRSLLAAAAAAADDGESKALLAVMLAIPTEGYLSELMSEIDVDGLHQSRKALRSGLGETLFDDWLALYENNVSRGPYQPDSRSVARRALRNLALSFLCAAGAARGATVRPLLMDHYATADNLTDRLAALREIVNAAWLAEADRSAVLDNFHARWQHEKLVIDQWFSAQAACPIDGALARVRALEAHPDFDGKNPNRVRALYGAFAVQNPKNFHARDGSGYRFLGERALGLDRVNPQLAARLLAPLTRWRRYDAARRLAMRDALRTIESAQGISADVFEVVSKSLHTDG